MFIKTFFPSWSEWRGELRRRYVDARSYRADGTTRPLNGQQSFVAYSEAYGITERWGIRGQLILTGAI